MKVVIQRVRSASVSIKGQQVSAIGQGLLVFLGIHQDDTQEDLEWMVRKLATIRLFPDDVHPMNLDHAAADSEFLVVSQFTLLASTRKGNRPGFSEAMEPTQAEIVYNDFVKRLNEVTGKVAGRGVFAAHMEISLINDGPVTIVIDSKNKGI